MEIRIEIISFNNEIISGIKENNLKLESRKDSPNGFEDLELSGSENDLLNFFNQINYDDELSPYII